MNNRVEEIRDQRRRWPVFDAGSDRFILDPRQNATLIQMESYYSLPEVFI